MPAAITAPPSSSAPAQPAQSAPSPAPAKATTAPKTAPAPSSPSSKAGKTSPAPSPEPPKSTTQVKADADPFEEAFSGLKKIAKVEADDLVGEETTPPKDQEQPKPDEKPAEEPKDEQGDVDEEQAKAEPGAKPTEKRPSPWKLIEHYKSQNQNLQQEIAQLRTKSGEPPKELSERMSSLEKRNQELEEHLRFIDYSKSQEFVDKYQKPYEEAWSRAVSALRGLKIQYQNPATGETQSQEVTPQHIAALASMDPATAREEIKRNFPEDKAEVLGYVNRIRDLYEVQHKALEEQKTKGGEWQQQQVSKMKSIQESNAKLWKQFSDESIQKVEFLRPVEGDDERNMRLEKATQFVADALSAKANDPKLSDEERAMAIKKHVALRNRAIAYSVLVHENKKLKAQLEEKENALKAFEESSPTDGNGRGKGPTGAGDVTMDSMAAMLHKLGR